MKLAIQAPRRGNTEMRNLFSGAIILLAASCAAQADVTYSNAAAWAAAVTGVTTINFEGIVNSGNQNCGSGCLSYGLGPATGTTVGGVNFVVGPTGADDVFFILGDGYFGYPRSIVSVEPTAGGAAADLLINLPSAVTALGFDFGRVFHADTATITLSDGSVQTVAAPSNPGLVFFGVTAPGGITSVDITLPAADSPFGLDMSDFSYGTANTTVPEPSSLLLFGTMLAGVAGVAGILRRRRQTR
jgi:hypothetical protein